MTRRISSLEAMAGLARDVAPVLGAGDVLRLRGPLGAGKTTFVRLLAGALGIETLAVSSPTFVIANRYARENGPDLVHVDAYRLENADEDALGGLGWDALVGDEAGTIAVIEWADRIADLLPDDAPLMQIVPTGEDSRDVVLALPQSWAGRPGVAALADDPRTDTTCPVTGATVAADSPTWPFFDERARMADLYGWFSGAYSISRAAEQADLEQGE